MNSIFTLHPYKFHGQWVFDDEATGLFREAFISGIDVMLDKLTENIPGEEQGFNLIFSEHPFPDFQVELKWLRSEFEGNWYRCEQFDQDGWLCPALFKYFEKAPESIFTKAEKRL